jgi:hypothetical protein
VTKSWRSKIAFQGCVSTGTAGGLHCTLSSPANTSRYRLAYSQPALGVCTCKCRPDVSARPHWALHCTAVSFSISRSIASRARSSFFSSTLVFFLSSVILRPLDRRKRHQGNRKRTPSRGERRDSRPRTYAVIELLSPISAHLVTRLGGGLVTKSTSIRADTHTQRQRHSRYERRGG